MQSRYRSKFALAPARTNGSPIQTARLAHWASLDSLKSTVGYKALRRDFQSSSFSAGILLLSNSKNSNVTDIALLPETASIRQQPPLRQCLPWSLKRQRDDLFVVPLARSDQHL